MNTVIDNMEALLIEAHKVKGWRFVHEQPLWVTWTLEKFGTTDLSVTEMSLIRPGLLVQKSLPSLRS
jgi:hypothetical protein